ncbi:MAG: hypothetical protein KKE50_02625, partial [Nanoarchaeota archaeon]|nr:hypothetical protein [Nanoarchaeota archaeon]
MNKKSQTKLVYLGIFLLVGVLIFVSAEIAKSDAEIRDIYTNDSSFNLNLPDSLQGYSGYSLRVSGNGRADLIDSVLEFASVEENLSILLDLKYKNENKSFNFSVYLVSDSAENLVSSLSEEGVGDGNLISGDVVLEVINESNSSAGN